MPIHEHPSTGTILTCDFGAGFKEPEMVKRRPVVVLSPKMSHRPKLCTVVSLSLTPPDHVMPYHRQIDIRPKLPPRWVSDGVWIKGDMVNTVAFHRLDFLSYGKDSSGKRLYHYSPLDDDYMKVVRQCVLRAIGLATLTKHL